MYTIVAGHQIGNYKIGMTTGAMLAEMQASPTALRDVRTWMSGMYTVVHQSADRQCQVSSDLRIGLVVLVALVGSSRASTSSGIRVGMSIGEALQLDDTLYLDFESEQFTSRSDPGVYFGLEDREPYVKDDFSSHIIERIEVTNRHLLDEILIARLDASILEDIRRKYIVGR